MSSISNGSHVFFFLHLNIKGNLNCICVVGGGEPVYEKVSEARRGEARRDEMKVLECVAKLTKTK